MKRAKLRRLVEEVLTLRDAVPEHPVVFDTLTVDFERRLVRFRGRQIGVDTPAIDFPMLSTDHLIWVKHREDSEVL